MKILIISGAFPPMHAGEATNAAYLAQRLADRGQDVHVLTTRGSNLTPYPRLVVHPIMYSWSWLELPRFRRFLATLAPDAVYLLYLGWIYKHEFMITFAPSLSKQLLPRATFVTRFENAMAADPRYTSLASRALRKVAAALAGSDRVDYAYGTLLRDSDRVIVLSDYHRALLSGIDGHVGNKSVLIPPPANMRTSEDNLASRIRGRQLLGISADHFLIIYIGYVHSGKGLESLLTAFRQVSKSRTNVRLAIVGGTIDPLSKNALSYAEEIRNYSKRLGIDDNVRWTGSYSWDDERASLYLRAADVCVLPFAKGVHLNNSSFACAVSHGLPTITTRPQVADEPIEHDRNVLLCSPGQADEIECAIGTLMDNPAQREKLRRGAACLASDWFSWDSAVDRTLETLRVPGATSR